MEECLQVLTSIDSQKKARLLRRRLLEERAAACVQVIGPVDSAYWWQGEIEEAREWLCLAKTHASTYERLESLIKQNHPYETPEIIVPPHRCRQPRLPGVDQDRDDSVRAVFQIG
jgi:periplasmic divalent cation tolerance protein